MSETKRRKTHIFLFCLYATGHFFSLLRLLCGFSLGFLRSLSLQKLFHLPVFLS